MSPLARAADRMVGWYQAARADHLSPCRFYPSCSTYAREALEQHGAVRGSWYALRRIGRCNPLGGHGYDPVPERAGPELVVSESGGELNV